MIVSDIEMPDEDGYSLIRRIRALAPASGGDVPAAALTAYASPADRMKVLGAGFNIHIAKPVQPAELAVVVASLAGRHTLRPAAIAAAARDRSLCESSASVRLGRVLRRRRPGGRRARAVPSSSCLR